VDTASRVRDGRLLHLTPPPGGRGLGRWPARGCLHRAPTNCASRLRHSRFSEFHKHPSAMIAPIGLTGGGHCDHVRAVITHVSTRPPSFILQVATLVGWPRCRTAPRSTMISASDYRLPAPASAAAPCQYVVISEPRVQHLRVSPDSTTALWCTPSRPRLKARSGCNEVSCGWVPNRFEPCCRSRKGIGEK
jgi:hypothetical protein